MPKPKSPRPQRVTISVNFDAELPADFNDLDVITLDLDVTKIRIDGEFGPLKGARITGYATQSIER